VLFGLVLGLHSLVLGQEGSDYFLFGGMADNFSANYILIVLILSSSFNKKIRPRTYDYHYYKDGIGGIKKH
jgi:ABC-type transport system involved in cytochrome bd biosynthesis fused ATPase/permease subunit